MSLKATIKIQCPEDVEVSMTLTMPLREWIELHGQLPSKYPAWRLTAAINQLVSQAKAQFTVEHEVSAP